MRYIGGKVRIAKQLVEAMRIPGDACYVEPFVGGGAVLEHVRARYRIASDAFRPIVALLQAVSQGWTPRTDCTQQMYELLKWACENQGMLQYLCAQECFDGFACSLQGAWLGGWDANRDCNQTNHKSRAEICRDVLLRSAPRLAGVHWNSVDYAVLPIPHGSYVYCDPPYAGTRGYATGAFDSDAFWRWAAEESRRSRVFVSELTAPTGWKPLWRGSKARMGARDGSRRVETLWARD